MDDLLTVMTQYKSDFRPRKRLSLDHFENVSELGFLSAQKFAARRSVIKKVTHFEGRPARMRCGSHLYRHLTPLAQGLMPPRGFRLSVGREQESRYRRNRSQGFATKPQRGHSFKVFDTVDFAGRVPRQREGEICLRNPRAVIADTQQSGPARLHVNLDSRSTGVEAVLDSFFHH